MTSSRVRIFDQDGGYITELNSVATTRSWVKNDIGTCELSISYLDPKCTNSVFEYGNLVFIEHKTLPPWVGIIDVERTWNPGFLTQKILSAERVLGLRAMPMKKVVGHPGSIFRQMLGFANDQTGLKIAPGNIEEGTEGIELELSTSMLDHLRQLVEAAPNEFSVTGALTPAGLLRLRANWFERSEFTEILVQDGAGSPIELSSPIMTEQGEFWTELIGYSDASTTETRLTSGPIRNNLAYSRYGLRQANVVFSGVKDKGTLIAMTTDMLNKNRAPRSIVTFKMVDVLDGSGQSIYFRHLRLGNVIKTTLTSAGFSANKIGFTGRFQIIGMQYSDLSDRVELVAEVFEG